MVHSQGVLYPDASGRGAGRSLKYVFVMAKSYQLVAWTEKGQVRMIPSQFNDYLNEELQHINQLGERVRYGTYYEVHDLLALSSAFEKLALSVLGMGKVEQGFQLLAQAAFCCTASENNWTDTEWGEMLCKPLRGRFFAMFCQCKDLVRSYPGLRYLWESSKLRQTCDYVTSPDRVFEIEWNGICGDFQEASRYNKALNFGKNEVYRRRKA